MNKTVLRALVALTVAALVSVQSLVATPLAVGTKSVLGGPSLSIGAAKTLTSVTQQLDGSYNISYLIVVHNYSNTTLYNVQVVDNLLNTFPGPAVFTLVGVPTATGTLSANASFNGAGLTNLLNAGSSTLAVDGEETIAFTVNVTVPAPGVYYNSAVASGTDVSGNFSVSDSSDWGTQTLPAGNDPTPTPLTANTLTSVGLAKTIIDTNLVNCQYEITYQLVVRNLGNEPLDNIQVTDILTNIFPSPISFTVSNVSLGGPAAGSAALGTPVFDGSTTTTFLDAANTTIGVGQDLYIFFTVTVDLQGQFGTFGNTASVTAQGTFSNQPTTDISDWGTNPDPDGDLNANEPNQNENNTTNFIVEGINVGVAKQANAQLQPDGSYLVTYVVTLVNYSNNAVSNMSLVDDLSQTFPAPVTYTFALNPFSSQGSLTLNNAYGTSSWELLDPSGFLGPNATATVSFAINVQLNNTTDTLFLNSATLNATGNCGLSFSDVSTNGTNPDPNFNNNPGDAGEDIPTPVVLKPTQTIIPGGFSPNGDGTNDLFVITNIAGKKVKVEIFNRWGAAVYKNDSYNNTWDGTSNTGLAIGDNLPTGTYWYVIKIDDTKEVKEYANYITLSR